jgi:DNA-binding transcriptional ArsR family regulator
MREGKMHRLIELRDTLGQLEAIVGRDVIHDKSLAIILCLAAAAARSEHIDATILSEKTDISPDALNRYIGMLTDAGVIELQKNPASQGSPIGISLTPRTLDQFAEFST